MKNLLLIVVAYCVSTPVFANILQAVVNNGNWTTASTWNTNTVPTNGDVTIIPAGITVIINTNIDDKSKTITVVDYGTLSFTGGNSQLNLGPLSEVVVYPGASIINGSGQGSHIINIGSNQVFKGNQGNIAGPQYATVSTPGFQPFSPLPVKFVSFSVALLSGEVKVEWTATDEVDVDHFEVERSSDGNNWNAIAKLNASGNGEQEMTYSYSDRNPADSKLFYRIKEVDHGGAANYTAIKSVNIGTVQPASFAISPLGQGRVMLQVKQPQDGVFVIRYISLSGQVVKQASLSNPSGNVIVSSSLHGDYIISISNGKDIQLATQMIL